MLNEIAKEIAETVKESVQAGIKEVSAKYETRIAELEKQLSDQSDTLKGIIVPKDDDIKEIAKGLIPDTKAIADEISKAVRVPEDGKSVTLDDVKPLIDEAVKGIDISHIEQTVKDAIKSIPQVKDGTDGKDGIDGKDGVSPTADEVAKSMEHIFAKWALDFERKADAVLEKAIDRMPKPKDGRDAIDIDGFDMVLGEDDRTVTVSLKRGDTVIEKSIKVPNIIDKGVFKHNATYEKGDAVTFGGCLWICQEHTTKNEPSSANDVWRLAVKRGRDGREVVKVDLPETVKVKKDGEDA